MPTHSQQNSSAGPATASRGYAQLERQLSLLGWLHHQLGYENTVALLEDIKDADEGFDENGLSHICTRLVSRAGQMHGLTPEDLHRYDDNIRGHLAAMNEGRAEQITLRYFQYLAALYTEIYLDWYCNRRNGLLPSLHRFIVRHNSNSPSGQHWDHFTSNDLTKLAFWMATGSGKTLLLHLHYRQFMHYNRLPLDNILLITPNEGLSEQHLEELQASNIPATRFDANGHSGTLGLLPAVRVTEITKLVMEKKGEGESIAVETLEGRNLVFVDEGHKGSGSDAKAWRNVRSALGKDGFTFEYSATFGQALAAAKDDELLGEYGKAIAFDYSYRYFYNDGYGKDFRVLNLQQDDAPEQTDTLLLANLLSFYEQQLVFADREKDLRPYNLSRPLWIFVGGSVNAVYRESNKPRSDIFTVVTFLHRVLSEPGWAIDAIDRLLNGDSGLLEAASGQDILADRFEYLRAQNAEPSDLYRDALAQVLHAGSGGLQLIDLRGSDGELGLRADGSDDYFGVIYIGDTLAFKRLVESEDSGIVVTDDALGGSLFDSINEPESTVEVLAGARKFIEGWNSWRVSNMGLLNIGRSEGSQIIQLFGRGVRLRGRDMSLKRSSALTGGPHPNHIRLLETLNIFALRANYMAQFRDYLESEGISTQEPDEIRIPIQSNSDFLNQGLVIPRLEEGMHFSGQETVLLGLNGEGGPVNVDMSATVQQIESGRQGLETAGASTGAERQIPPESLSLVDWNAAYLSLLEYKESKEYSNLIVQPAQLRSILEAGEKAYLLVADEGLVQPRNRDDQRRLQEAVTNILRRYADKLYRHRKSQWESKTLTYRQLDDSDGNFQLNGEGGGDARHYIVRVPPDNEGLAEKIRWLMEDCEKLYKTDQGALPRIHFDRHLYQPLLVERDGVTSSPPGLQPSERRFVADLREYYASDSSVVPPEAELFLLRNLTRGKGVGFFESNGFYPDFILWVKSASRQRIIFVEPHGMRHAQAYDHDEKARLHERLPELAEEISERSGISEVELDSFIVSTTSYEELRRQYQGDWTRDDFADKHILFQEPDQSTSYIKQILQANR